MLRRVRLLVRCARKCGLRPTWVTVRAKQKGANQKFAEFATLALVVARLCPRVVIEIGTERGGTFWAWSRLASPAATLVSIDLPGNPGDAHLPKYVRDDQKMVVIRGDSHDPETVSRLDAYRGAVDFLFIDGDHSYKGVRSDFENYAPLVKSGGLIAFHDIAVVNDPTIEVRHLWQELRDVFDTREFVDSHKGPGIGVVFWRGPEDVARWSRQ